jgi:hypothetical protein
MFQSLVWNSYQEQLEMDTEMCRLQYSKENLLLSFVYKNSEFSNFLRSKK